MVYISHIVTAQPTWHGTKGKKNTSVVDSANGKISRVKHAHHDNAVRSWYIAAFLHLQLDLHLRSKCSCANLILELAKFGRKNGLNYAHGYIPQTPVNSELGSICFWIKEFWGCCIYLTRCLSPYTLRLGNHLNVILMSILVPSNLKTLWLKNGVLCVCSQHCESTLNAPCYLDLKHATWCNSALPEHALKWLPTPQLKLTVQLNTPQKELHTLHI